CAIGALVVASCLLYVPPLVIQVTLDGILPDAPGPGLARDLAEAVGRDDLRSRLWIPALAIALAALLAGVFTYLRGRWSARASERIVRGLRDRMYDHLQRLPCTYFDRSETGDLLQRCTSDVETVRLFLANQVVEIGRAVIMLLVPLPIMLLIDWRMAVASVVFLPAVVAFSVFFFVKIKHAFLEKDEAEGRMTTCIQENLTGIRVVRAFHRQAFEIEKFRASNREHRDLDFRLYVLLARFWSISDVLCFAQRSLVVGMGVYWVANGRLEIGAFFFFLSAVTLFLYPIRVMGRILTDLGKAVVALTRIEEILDHEAESLGPVPDRLASAGAIRFEDVSFAHGAQRVVRHVSFDIEPGRTVALLGPSGSGKSTIINLLLRLYDPDAGRILLDGVDIAGVDRRAVRRSVAAVLQEPFLFSKSIRENVKLGRTSASEDEMVEATSLACIHESILDFEEGYETRVGERGVTLSGGQRQRVAIARALLQDPPVLVLDDALSAIDTETEAAILDAIRARSDRRTTIIIAHRVSTLMHADEILVVEDGSIVQRGSHEALRDRPGLYRRLWALQHQLEDDRLDEGPLDRDAGREDSDDD
ncbi:MAG: ABC transporter ATP-binding protein, partial [Phycisphaerales bacterium]|nr:ABC transporter ATP-binding protein [Phycisphaerales bacterium]